MRGNKNFGGHVMINAHTLLIYAIICGVFGEEEDILKRLARSRGIPGIDYPTYRTIPKTSFQCWQQKYNPGMYADPETDCQVFHQCFGYRQESFLCPAGTTFNQPILTCDYWYSSNCSLAPLFYHLNAKAEEDKHVHFGTSDQIQFDAPSDNDYRDDGTSINQEESHESEFLFERMADLFDPLAENERLKKSGINDAFLEDEFEQYLYVNKKENKENLPENEIFIQNDNEFVKEQSGLTPGEFKILDHHNEKLSELNNRILHFDFGEGNAVLSFETEEEQTGINSNLEIQNKFMYLTTQNPQILKLSDFEENQSHEDFDQEYSGDSEDEEISLLAEERSGTNFGFGNGEIAENENVREHSLHLSDLTDPNLNFLTDTSDKKAFSFPESETDFTDVARFKIQSSKLSIAPAQRVIENKESLRNQLTNSKTSNANTAETSDDGRTHSKKPDSESQKNTRTTGFIDHTRQNMIESTTLLQLAITNQHENQKNNHLTDSQENLEAFLKRAYVDPMEDIHMPIVPAKRKRPKLYAVQEDASLQSIAESTNSFTTSNFDSIPLATEENNKIVNPMEDIHMPIVPAKRKRPKLYVVQEDASLQSITESTNFFTTSNFDSIPLVTEEKNKNVNTDLISHTKEEFEHPSENELPLEYNLPDQLSGLRVSSTHEEIYEPADIEVYSHNPIYDVNENGNENQQRHLELFYGNRLRNRLPYEVLQDEHHSNEVNSELWNSIAEGKLTIEVENDNDFALADGEIGISGQTGVLPNIEYSSDSLRSLYEIEQESQTSFDNYLQSDQIPFQEEKKLTPQSLHDYISSEDDKYLFDNSMHSDNLIPDYKILQLESIAYEDKESLLSEENGSLLSVEDESLLPEEDDSLLSGEESLLSEDGRLISEEDERLLSQEDESFLSENNESLLSEDVGFVSEDGTLVYEDENLVTEDDKLIAEGDNVVVEDDNIVVDHNNVVVEGHSIVSVDGNLVFVNENRFPELENTKVEEEMPTQLNHNGGLHENLAKPSKFKITFDDAKEDEKYGGQQVSHDYLQINKSPMVAWLKQSFDMIPKLEKTQLISLKESSIPSAAVEKAALNNNDLKHIKNVAFKSSGITFKSEKARDGRKEDYSRHSRSNFFPSNLFF